MMNKAIPCISWIFQTNLVDVNSKGEISGSLYFALTYRRRKYGNVESDEENVSVELTDEQKDRVKNYLKTCCLPGDKNQLKVILSQYKDFRKNLIKTSFNEYKSLWSFYFVCPDLVKTLQYRLCL